MEQKHIDEIDESFLGEEFVDEEESRVPASVKTMGSKERKALPKKRQKVAVKKAGKSADMEKKLDKKLDKKELSDDDIIITPAKEMPELQLDSQPKVINDPWDDQSAEVGTDGFFKDTGTWKAITGIVVILLLLSVFTQGFQFSAGASATGEQLTVSQAEERALSFVNSQLLRPPFQAQVSKSEEVNDLFKITLSVAGEEVDSYLTKDGELFFPQGFNIEEAAALRASAAGEASAQAVEQPSIEGSTEEESGVEETSGSEGNVSEEGASSEGLVVSEPEASTAGTETAETGTTDGSAEEVVVAEEAAAPEVAPEEAAPSGTTVPLTIQAKKWLFSPNKLTVSQGDTVQLTIVPDGFSFTFSIPELGVEEEVNGRTVVEFAASQAGTFEFSCSSCEDWRGMTGTLLVE